jgi:serine/threonine-protein kinase
MMSVPWQHWEGQVIDGCFLLRQHLGGSEQSAVFLAQYGGEEPQLAAIKLILSATPDAELFPQWERAAQLTHPHLLRLLRWGNGRANQANFDYAVTEYAEENLAEVLAERPLTAAEAREMLAPVLDALAYIHGEGLVHGHLKPANLLAIGNQLKLSVDGIARVGDAGTAPSQPGPYDPPEFPERGRSPVGDVWSLGITLTEALTQQLPRPAEGKQEPVLPKTLPAEFLPVVRACLQPDPRRRSTLADIAALLRRPAAAPEPRPVAPPKPQRSRRGLVLVAGIVVALAAAIFAAPRILHRSGPSPAETVNITVTVPPATAPAADKTPVPPAPEQPAALEPPTAKPQPTPLAGESDTEKPRATAVHPPADHAHVVSQVLPDIPEKARRTIRGKVTIHVRAKVDPSGHVTSAGVESGSSRYLTNLTLQAARQWVFEPAKSGGRDVASEWALEFEITSRETVVSPSRVAP